MWLNISYIGSVGTHLVSTCLFLGCSSDAILGTWTLAGQKQQGNIFGEGKLHDYRYSEHEHEQLTKYQESWLETVLQLLYIKDSCWWVGQWGWELSKATVSRSGVTRGKSEPGGSAAPSQVFGRLGDRGCALLKGTACSLSSLPGLSKSVQTLFWKVWKDILWFPCSDFASPSCLCLILRWHLICLPDNGFLFGSQQRSHNFLNNALLARIWPLGSLSHR